MEAVFPKAKRPVQGPAVLCRPSKPSRPRPSGFTLVEMLTVIVIIAILASFVTATAVVVRRHAREVATGVELSQLDAALQTYKQKYNSFPPDFAGPDAARAQAAVINHLGTAFPRYVIPGSTTADQWNNLQTTVMTNYGVDINLLDPAAALVFWLGGPPEAAGSNRLVGFSANPKNPFDLGGSRLPVLYEFDPERLKSENGILRYFPEVISGESAPYVYFRASAGGYTDHPGFTPPATHPNWGVTGPCQDTRISGGGWSEPKTFQIRAAGLDGVFGDGVQFPAGTDYDEATMDDQTNFSGGTFEDKM